MAQLVLIIIIPALTITGHKFSCRPPISWNKSYFVPQYYVICRLKTNLQKLMVHSGKILSLKNVYFNSLITNGFALTDSAINIFTEWCDILSYHPYIIWTPFKGKRMGWIAHLRLINTRFSVLYFRMNHYEVHLMVKSRLIASKWHRTAI